MDVEVEGITEIAARAEVLRLVVALVQDLTVGDSSLAMNVKMKRKNLNAGVGSLYTAEFRQEGNAPR